MKEREQSEAVEREQEREGERERLVKDWRKEGNGSRGRGFVREFLTKKTGGFGYGKGGFGNKDERIWYQKRADLGGEMQ